MSRNTGSSKRRPAQAMAPTTTGVQKGNHGEMFLQSIYKRLAFFVHVFVAATSVVLLCGWFTTLLKGTVVLPALNVFREMRWKNCTWCLSVFLSTVRYDESNNLLLPRIRMDHTGART